MPLHSHHYSVPIDVQLLLQIGRRRAGHYLQPSRQCLAPDEPGMSPHRIEH
jgi:hypothetical protein